MAAKSTSRRKSPSRAKSTSPRGSAPDAIDLLTNDHEEVRELFSQFEDADEGDKRALANAICSALKAHAVLEETMFYPAAFEATGNGDLLAEALVEHAAARDLIAQIEAGFPGEPMYDARVRVLAEYVEHHVGEEEGELFPACRNSGMDLQSLGEEMRQRKQALMSGLAVPNPALALS